MVVQINLSSLAQTLTLLSLNEWPLPFRHIWTADSWPEESAPLCRALHFISDMLQSVQSSLRWNANSLALCLGVLPSRWTDLCPRVLPGFKWTGMWCLLKTLYSFSQNTHNVGDGRGLALFLFSQSVFNEGPDCVVTWFEGELRMMTLLFFDFIFGENILSLVVEGSGNTQLML